jgi:hypothetical protein
MFNRRFGWLDGVPGMLLGLDSMDAGEEVRLVDDVDVPRDVMGRQSDTQELERAFS